MSSFPISITWQVATPPTGSFDQLASAATKLDSALQASGQKFDQFGSTIEQLESPLGSVGSSMGELGDNMEGLDSSLGSSGDAMGELAGATEDLNGSIGETGGFVEDAAGGMDELSTGAEDAGGALEDMSGSLEDTNTALEDTVPALEDTTTGLEDTNTALEDTVPALEDTNTALEDTVPALEDTATALEDTVPAAEDTGTAFEDAVPAIEDTATALEDTTPALEDTNTALEDMGTAIEDDVTAAGDFTGALSGMSDANEGVTGGLTTNNTLMGNLSGATDTTTGSTNALTGSFGKAALGMAGAVGAGVALFNMWDAMGDAQVAVDAANIRLDRSQTMVDKSMLAMSRTLAKLNGDMSLGVTGLGEYNAAFAAFNSLVESGVTSGATYEAALTRLQTAHRGLSSNTAEGQKLISQLGIQMDTAAQKIGMTAVAANAYDNALEAANEATVNFYANSVPTLIAGLGSLATTMTDIPKAAKNIKSTFAAISAFMTASVVPSLIAAKAGFVAMVAPIAAIAVPVGIAIAALAAFTAVVLAIRTHLKVFDDLGVKVGNVFPQMRGFLDGARQAFINLSDGLNTAISGALWGIDQLTGGVGNLQAQWEGFTDTLPKGTGEIGILGQTTQKWGAITADASEKINIGAGKWTEAQGRLVAFNGAVNVAAESWYTLSDGTAVYVKSANEGTAATAKLTAVTEKVTTTADAFGATAQTSGIAVKDFASSIDLTTPAARRASDALSEVLMIVGNNANEMQVAEEQAQAYLRLYSDAIPGATGLAGAALVGYTNFLRDEKFETFKAAVAASEYITSKGRQAEMAGKTEEQIIALAESMKEEYKETEKVVEVTAKHVEELQKLQTTLQENAAELAFYADAGNLAGRMQLEFSIGTQEAELNLIKQQAALARNNGVLQGNIILLAEGKLQAVAYAEGVYEAANALVEMALALENTRGAYEATNMLIEEAGLLALAQSVGFMEAKKAVQDETIELHKAVGALGLYNDAAQVAAMENNALIRGFTDTAQSINDTILGFQEAIGAIEVYQSAIGNADTQQKLFNTGMAEGKAEALGWGANVAKNIGHAEGFRNGIEGLARALGMSFTQALGQSTEQMQRFIEVVVGSKDAFGEVVNAIHDMGQKIVDRLGKAGEEGKNAFGDNMKELEKELGVQFSEPLKRALLYETNIDKVKTQVDTALSTLAVVLRDSAGSLQIDNTPAIDAINMVKEVIARAVAEGAKGFGSLTETLNQLAAVDFANMAELAPVMAQLVTESENLGGPTEELLSAFGQMPAFADRSAKGLAAINAELGKVGLSMDQTGNIWNTKTGEMLGNVDSLAAGAKDPLQQLVDSILGTGAGAAAAKVQWATEIALMKNLIATFVAESAKLLILSLTAWTGWAVGVNQQLLRVGQDLVSLSRGVVAFVRGVQSSAVTISGAFNNMATNVNTSLATAARGLITFQGILTNFIRATQSGATTVSGAFNNMATNITSSTTRARSAITTLQSSITTLVASGSRVSSLASSFASAMSRVSSSASTATSRVRALQSAINALRSKTITLTTIIRTVRQTVFAAQGGAFIQSNPGKVGPLSVSEFGQKELVTVTPLETPGRNAVKGISNLIQDAAEKKRRRAMDEDKGAGEGKPSRRKEVVMVREVPIILQVDGRELSRVVNKRIFEESDALT